jgi:hypothetical protein
MGFMVDNTVLVQVFYEYFDIFGLYSGLLLLLHHHHHHQYSIWAASDLSIIVIAFNVFPDKSSKN